MGNLIKQIVGAEPGFLDSEEGRGAIADLRRLYGTTQTVNGPPVIRIALPWHREYWESGWPETDPPSQRIRIMATRMNPEKFILGSVIQRVTQKDFRWSVNQHVLPENAIGEWRGRCRTELDAKLTIERILKENDFKFLEEKHFLLG